MFSRILVGLDGSDLAERVLPHVETLAEKFDSRVTLLQATTPPGAIIAGTAAGADPVAGPVVDPTPIIQAERQEASNYLEVIARRLRARGLKADTTMPVGSAAEELLEYARVNAADLIAMTTHGRSGLGRLVFGSVADAVLRHAPCPILLVRVAEEED